MTRSGRESDLGRYQFRYGPTTPSERAHTLSDLGPIWKSQVPNAFPSILNPPPNSEQQNPSSGAMPPPLPDELVEEVLFRLPPENPAGLVRAGLVCTRWCRLVCDPGFRRCFREFHRRPPMLGMLCSLFFGENLSKLIPTTGFCFPRTDFPGLRVLDARHGRVLGKRDNVLVVWHPITDKVRELPLPRQLQYWTAAVLCSAAAGACDHLHCHHGPFLVVFVCIQHLETFVYTYSSDAAAWSEPVCAQQDYVPDSWMGSALVGSALYFGNVLGSTALKYDLELCQMSLILLPSLPRKTLWESLLTTTEDGGLGLVYKDDHKLYTWSRKDTHEVDAKWERRVIVLKAVFPVDFVVDAKLSLIASGAGIIFMRTGDEVYTIDLKTYKVKKVYKGTARTIVPYMSFYTPVLRVATTGEGLNAGASTAEQT